jgi:hypothetical protein
MEAQIGAMEALLLAVEAHPGRNNRKHICGIADITTKVMTVSFPEFMSA